MVFVSLDLSAVMLMEKKNLKNKLILKTIIRPKFVRVFIWKECVSMDPGVSTSILRRITCIKIFFKPELIRHSLK
jgi:hypothetical protein